jgi:hypothetical protein
MSLGHRMKIQRRTRSWWKRNNAIRLFRVVTILIDPEKKTMAVVIKDRAVGRYLFQL